MIDREKKKIKHLFRGLSFKFSLFTEEKNKKLVDCFQFTFMVNQVFRSTHPMTKIYKIYYIEGFVNLLIAFKFNLDVINYF